MFDQKKIQLSIIFFTIVIYLVGFGIIVPIIPLLGKEFGATPSEIGFLMATYSLMQFVFSPLWGKISDRVGRRPVLLTSLLGEGVSYIFFAFASGLEGLFVARCLAGFFGAGISTASAYISDITPPHERSRGMALIGAAFGLGFIIGPALGGVLSSLGEHFFSFPHSGMSFAAMVVAGICLATFLFGLKFLTESLQQNTASPPPLKTNHFQQAFHYLKTPLIGKLMSTHFINSIAFSIMEAALILLVADRFNWKIKEVGFGFTYIGIVATLSQVFLVRPMLPKLGEKKLLLTGLICLSISLAGIALATHVWLLAVTMTLLALGNSMINPSVLGGISLLTPASEQGLVLGIAQGLAALGRVLGPALGGILYQILSNTAPFYFASGLSALALAIVVSVYARLPNSAKTATAPR